MKVKLRDLPISVDSSEHTSIVRVVHDMKSCTVHFETYPSKRKIEVLFSGVVGLKVLDEREFAEFWRNNIESYEEIRGALVAQVLAGGWSHDEQVRGSFISAGFYGDVLEFFVSGDYECVNILCTEQPLVSTPLHP